MVFQSYALFPHLTVGREHRVRARGARHARGARPRERARAAAELVGCAHLLDRRPGAALRRRAAAGGAGPGAGPRARRVPARRATVQPGRGAAGRRRGPSSRRCTPRVGATMVHVTHDQTEALVLGDRIAVLRDGSLEQVGTPDEIWRRPATAFVARFVGLAGDEPAARRRAVAGPDRRRPEHRSGVRPEHVRARRRRAAAREVDGVEVVGEDALRPPASRRRARSSPGCRPPSRPGGGRRPCPSRSTRQHVHLFDAATGERIGVRRERPAPARADARAVRGRAGRPGVAARPR